MATHLQPPGQRLEERRLARPRRQQSGAVGAIPIAGPRIAPASGASSRLNADADGHGTDFPDGIRTVNASIQRAAVEMEGKRLAISPPPRRPQASRFIQRDFRFRGLHIRVNGRSLLTGKHETSATALIANLPIDRALAARGPARCPVTGTLAATAQVAGTMEDRASRHAQPRQRQGVR